MKAPYSRLALAGRLAMTLPRRHHVGGSGASAFRTASPLGRNKFRTTFPLSPRHRCPRLGPSDVGASGGPLLMDQAWCSGRSVVTFAALRGALGGAQ